MGYFKNRRVSFSFFFFLFLLLLLFFIYIYIYFYIYIYIFIYIYFFIYIFIYITGSIEDLLPMQQGTEDIIPLPCPIRKPPLKGCKTHQLFPSQTGFFVI